MVRDPVPVVVVGEVDELLLHVVMSSARLLTDDGEEVQEDRVQEKAPFVKFASPGDQTPSVEKPQGQGCPNPTSALRRFLASHRLSPARNAQGTESSCLLMDLRTNSPAR